MINGFKAYLKRLKEKYEKCENERERKTLSKKIAECEELIRDLEGTGVRDA